MKIILDGMGGDNAPEAIVEGAVQASKVIKYKICIVGDKELIEKELSKHKYQSHMIEVVHSEEVISNDEAPVKAVRTKQKSSMVIGINMVKSGEGDVFISAGNTGAIMAGGLFILGRIQGIDRPALATTYPILGKGVSLMVDSGANSECKPNNLLEFATMGAIYMEKVLDIKEPTVGLVNIGSEETKGTTVLRGAYELLTKSKESDSGVNFIGNVEARDIPRGVVNVIVCDGFVGNVILKLTEGLAWTILKLLKQKFTSGTIPKIGAVLLSGKLKELKNEFDYSEYGGAPILGVKGAMVKMHGSSSANAVKNTIVKAIPYMENGVVQTIQNAVLDLEEITTSE